MVRPDPCDPGADNWYTVEDRRQRKRIQDRLAQRARRKRLTEAKINGSLQNRSIHNNNNGDAATPLTPQSVSVTTANNDNDDTYLPIARSPNMSNFPMEVFIKDGVFSKTGVSSEMPMTVWAALYLNGSMMGLGCSTCYPAKSLPAQPHIPESLHPTALQLYSIHPLWIDRFPFPRMRDNIIHLMGLIDEEEFIKDIFCMMSFKIKPGGASWDPNAWVIGKEFGRKWGFLFTGKYS
ncbi:hypothetical protein BGW36DRAFT_424953 [Talaromyces proteolyticus]|uniref:BZIP domain-containing protein n=1 Tax=Talaromyces proteolyticus TaxID=1131652 RepID=A0AAD4Q285_9EURO|nr:uncharacterized protein BGW36DRAFT_424953 [Talaromyces proteolyticus]KAH8700116.1 hypothetical protein BGW36DRAFT_424953 [Talaromyces proteolyticus]